MSKVMDDNFKSIYKPSNQTKSNEFVIVNLKFHLQIPSSKCNLNYLHSAYRSHLVQPNSWEAPIQLSLR